MLNKDLGAWNFVLANSDGPRERVQRWLERLVESGEEGEGECLSSSEISTYLGGESNVGYSGRSLFELDTHLDGCEVCTSKVSVIEETVHRKESSFAAVENFLVLKKPGQVASPGYSDSMSEYPHAEVVSEIQNIKPDIALTDADLNLEKGFPFNMLGKEDPGRKSPRRDLGSTPVESAKTTTPSLQFSYYLRALEDNVASPDSEIFNSLLDSLRRALVHELRRRGLWNVPPQYLGVIGSSSWEESGSLDELLLDCYEFVFVRRLPGLMKQLKTKSNIDGLVFCAITSFLHEAQKHHDPLGFRIFQIARTAVKRLLDEDNLYRLTGAGSYIQDDTLLAFLPWSSINLYQAVDLRPQIENWSSSLVHDLVVAHYREPVVKRLAEAISALAEAGFETFRFRDLVDPLKVRIREHWQALSWQYINGENPNLYVSMLPGANYEARQQFEYLLKCTLKGIDCLEDSKRTKEYLRRLWLFLRNYALESDDPTVPTSCLPSDARLGELLGIPRARLRKLKIMLREIVQSCRRCQ